MVRHLSQTKPIQRIFKDQAPLVRQHMSLFTFTFNHLHLNCFNIPKYQRSWSLTVTVSTESALFTILMVSHVKIKPSPRLSQ